MLSNRFITQAVLAIVVSLASFETGQCQLAGSSPVYRVREGRNEISLFERFSTFIEHSARIRRVMDFDEEIVTVQPVEGNPNQIRVYANRSGVTTVTIVDENDATYSVEILVRGDVRYLESVIRRLYPNDSIMLEEINGEAVRLDGWVSKPEYVSEIQAIAEQFYPTVLNHMKTGGVQQILLKCTIMEVQRSKLRRLGMNFSLIRPDEYLISTPGPITPITSLTAAPGGATATFSGFGSTSINYGLTRPNGIFQAFIQAMIEENILKTHATPMIVTHNGRPANFLSGGEVPVPTSSGLGTVGIEFREFGIQMNAVPFILGNGRVRLEVETIVRDRDFANTVTIGGSTTTGFRTNSANTQVEMNFGEALVIAGLVSHRENASAQKLPFVGELPWIGAAFSRKSHEESEIELIILVTPDLVAPMPAGQVPGPGPGQSTDTPVDREIFAHGHLEVPKFGDECEFCPNCMATGGHCPSYPNCRHGNSDCLNDDDCVSATTPRTGTAATGLRISPVSKSTAAPAGKTPSASRAVDAERTPPAVPKRSGSRSGSAGLISPTMR